MFPFLWIAPLSIYLLTFILTFESDRWYRRGVFAVLALAWLQSAIRAWTRDVSHWLVFVALGVTVLLAVFAWTSFRRARQLR